ncbi:MAG: radical SAM protein [Thalassobaculaceae bacterium]|nr:radical SAM protein [Thalassobaculaceae bacterium]
MMPHPIAAKTEAEMAPAPGLRDLPNPDPAAGLRAYRDERAACLRADRRRWSNYRRYRASTRREVAPDYLPIKLDIENVSRCNFRCTMCSVSQWPKGRRAGDMTVDAFKALIDTQSGLVEIKLQGMGEPLMQRDPYFEMIRYARARRIWVRTTTNGSLLHLNDHIAKLVAADPNEVQISIDGATADVYEAIRRGSVFDRVTRNVADLNAAFAAAGKTRTKMWTVVQHANAHQLADLVHLAASLGFKSQVFSLEMVDWGLESWRAANNAVTVTDDLDPVELRALVERGRELGVRVQFWHTTEKYSTSSPADLCPWPFERAFIGSDGRIVPCCTIGNPDVMEIAGNGGSMKEVWFGEAFAEFRRAHLMGRIPKACRSCYV